MSKNKNNHEAQQLHEILYEEVVFMKKTLVFIFSLLLAFSLFGCSYNRPTSKTKTTDTTDKIISLVTGFNVSDTNGFDYSLKQIYESQVVNFHSVNLRIDDENNQASRIETIKELNGNINESLYNESTIETYYKNNEIIIKDNDEWIRKEYSYDDCDRLQSVLVDNESYNSHDTYHYYDNYERMSFSQHMGHPYEVYFLDEGYGPVNTIYRWFGSIEFQREQDGRVLSVSDGLSAAHFAYNSKKELWRTICALSRES